MPQVNGSPLADPAAMDQIRGCILKEYSTDNQIYDAIDVENLNNEWAIKRFLLHCNGDHETALNMLKESLKWRKSFGVNQLRETDFPAEFYQSGSFFPYEKDKNGNVVIYLRGKLHRKLLDWTELFKKFFIFVVESVEKQTGGRNYALFWDCEGAGLQNVDLDMLNFMTKTVSNYYPYGLEYVLLHELPWVLHQIYNIAKSWVPQHYQRLAQFCGKSEVDSWIAKANQPDYLGGVCARDYRKPPSGILTAEQLAKKYNLKKDAAAKLRDHLETYCKP